MSDISATRERIQTLLSEHPIVLFMKGTRRAPQCGFSAATVDRLDELLEEYATVNVLADEDIRQGIKEYGNWPTIPQLYVRGELVGGADIVQTMYDSGELHRLLGAPEPDRTPPTITISDEAAHAIRAALVDAGEMKLFLVVDGHFQPQFQLREANGHELTATSNGIEIRFDLASAQRARGASIGWAETANGAGLSISLPAAPSQIRSINVAELKQRLDAGTIAVIDVRPPQDRARAPFARAEALDASSQARLFALDKDAPLAFLCHHGNSSRGAAEHFRSLGFRNVHNVEGGIDAWSREIDPSIPLY